MPENRDNSLFDDKGWMQFSAFLQWIGDEHTSLKIMKAKAIHSFSIQILGFNHKKQYSEY